MRLTTIAVVVTVCTVCYGQQGDKDALRQQAFALLTQAREQVASTPAGARKRVLDNISIVLFQAGDETGSAGLLKEAMAADKEDFERQRTRAQRPSAIGNGFAFSGAGNSIVLESQRAQLHSVVGDHSGARAWIQEALSNLAAVSEERERTSCVTQIARAQIVNGDLESAQQILQQIPSRESNWLPEIAEAYARRGDLGSAKRILQQQSETRTPEILEKIAQGQVEANDLSSAMATAISIGSDSIQKASSEVRALVAIAEAQSRKGNTQAAKATYERALKDGGTFTVARHEVALSLARVGRVAEALQFADSVPSGRASAYDLMEIAVWAGKALHPEVAKQALAAAYAAILNEPPESPESQQPQGQIPDRRQLELQRFAIAQAQAGDIAGALATAKTLEDRVRAPALRGIASAQATAGDISGAEATLASDPHTQLIAARTVDGKIRAGDFEAAFQAARQSGTPDGIDKVFRSLCKPAMIETCLAAVGQMTFPDRRALGLIGMAENLLGVSPPVLPEIQKRLETEAFDPNR